jgi:hypothetical protein
MEVGSELQVHGDSLATDRIAGVEEEPWDD